MLHCGSITSEKAHTCVQSSAFSKRSSKADGMMKACSKLDGNLFEGKSDQLPMSRLICGSHF